MIDSSFGWWGVFVCLDVVSLLNGLNVARILPVGLESSGNLVYANASNMQGCRRKKSSCLRYDLTPGKHRWRKPNQSMTSYESGLKTSLLCSGSLISFSSGFPHEPSIC